MITYGIGNEEYCVDVDLTKSSELFVKHKLIEVSKQFPSIRIKYEKHACGDHIIEILPLEMYNNESYMEVEQLIEKEFGNYFPQESIAFVSEESLTKVCEPSFEIN